MRKKMIKKYPPISAKELIAILGTTIKHDNVNKLVAFLCQLSAYTEDSQFNLSFNAPSSSGKSYIPIEIAKLFPEEDVLELGYVSPTSFFHSASEYNEETEEYIVDLSRKIIIFLDQPHTMLLEHLRPLLSHDKKEIKVQITDKQQKHGLRAKKIILRGYPAVIFCSAGLRMDEQEATRFLLLSPEVTQEKIREGVLASLKKSSDRDAYWDYTELNVPRQQLKGRIQAIKDSEIADIRITQDDQDYIEQRFLSSVKMLKPRHQRDIKRLVSISKIFALLNIGQRKNEGFNIVAERSDIEDAFVIWEKISVSQELNIPPYVYRIYEDIILAAFDEKNSNRNKDFVDLTGTIGINRQEIMKKHYAVYGRMMDSISLRQQILPMLSQAGLITEEQDPNDKRARLVYPNSQNNSELDGGVNELNDEHNKILKNIKEIWPDAKSAKKIDNGI